MAISSHLSGYPQASWVPMQFENERALKGVQEGTINRSEFLDISARMNDLRELGDSFGTCGWTPEQTAQIQLRRQALSTQMGAYEKGEFQLPNVPTGMIQEAQNKQSGQIFDGLKEGTISRHEGQMLMTNVQDTANGSLSARTVDLMFSSNQNSIEWARSARESNPRETSLSTSSNCPPPSAYRNLATWASPGAAPQVAEQQPVPVQRAIGRGRR